MTTKTQNEEPGFQPGNLAANNGDCDHDNEFEDIDGDEWPSQEYSDWDPEYNGEDIDNSDILETIKDRPEGQKPSSNDHTNINGKNDDLTPGCDNINSVGLTTRTYTADDEFDHDNNGDMDEFKNDPIGAESALIAMTQPPEKYHDHCKLLTKFGDDENYGEDEKAKEKQVQCWECPNCSSINSLVHVIVFCNKYFRQKKRSQILSNTVTKSTCGMAW